MEIGIDSFAATTIDPQTGIATDPVQDISRLLERMKWD